MTITMSMTAKCNKCSKTFSADGTKMTHRAFAEKLRKAGWQWVLTGTQFCPDHRGKPGRVAKGKKGAAKAKKAAPKKKAKAYAKPAVKKAARRVINPNIVLGAGESASS